GEPAESVPAAAPVDILFDFSITRPLPAGRLELHVRNEFGETLFVSTSADASGLRTHEWTRGRQRRRCRIPGNLLRPGRYSVTVNHPFGGYDLLHQNILTFTINEQGSPAADGREGKISPVLEWRAEEPPGA
ncbi:MAG TPA: hypothetical protein VNL91_08335, partial [Thermoanaerobaculia bacterium]|nr:hypothetical protein [Thermoanaerobaculia bacterium]